MLQMLLAVLSLHQLLNGRFTYIILQLQDYLTIFQRAAALITSDPAPSDGTGFGWILSHSKYL